MNTASETGSDVFEVKYFDRKAYLAQSPQFYKQMAMAAGIERVFMVGPVFRAEPSFTTRHLTEFTGWDFEASYISDHSEIMSMEEDMLISGFKNVKEKLGSDIEVPSKPFPKITLKEVKKLLAEKGLKNEKVHDLSPEEERTLCEIIKEKNNSDFVFVTDYPVAARPFYHMHHEDDPTLTKSFDLLYKGVEVTTGAQREHRFEVLKKQAVEKGMDIASLEGYMNFFRYGCPPHGGAGIGPARIIMRLLELPTVKEATFLPRDVKRLTP
ncbi:MAG: Aspartyl-tRNA synthetase [candidate division WWE3 bacterium GW2011_GWB1_42_41]|nr:MAG: Aspartyl-tRNA synthetase [candidate division WWE3 bacterium GW2011_GWB1_42_41]